MPNIFVFFAFKELNTIQTLWKMQFAPLLSCIYLLILFIRGGMGSTKQNSNSENCVNESDHKAHHEKFVKLNVGGSHYLTTVDTLTKYDSMLKSLFSGPMKVSRDHEGYVLIDRSGKHFGLILNFLRDGTVPLPESISDIHELLIEAKYYLIQGLVDLCNSSIMSMESDQITANGATNVLIVRSDPFHDCGSSNTYYIHGTIQENLLEKAKNIINKKYNKCYYYNGNPVELLELLVSNGYKITSSMGYELEKTYGKQVWVWTLVN